MRLTAGDNRVTADFLMARATAKCGPGGASFSGSSDVAVLTVNGQRITVTGEPNQTVALPGGGKVVVNEQTSDGGITVNALHRRRARGGRRGDLLRPGGRGLREPAALLQGQGLRRLRPWQRQGPERQG